MQVCTRCLWVQLLLGEGYDLVCCKGTVQGEADEHLSSSQCCSWLLQSLAPTHSRQPGQMEGGMGTVSQHPPQHRQHPQVSGPPTHHLTPPDLAPLNTVLASPQEPTRGRPRCRSMGAAQVQCSALCYGFQHACIGWGAMRLNLM